MMVVGRLSCDRLATRFGSANAIRGGGFISGTGLAIGLIIGNTGGVIFGWFWVDIYFHRFFPDSNRAVMKSIRTSVNKISAPPQARLTATSRPVFISEKV